MASKSKSSVKVAEDAEQARYNQLFEQLYGHCPTVSKAKEAFGKLNGDQWKLALSLGKRYALMQHASQVTCSQKTTSRSMLSEMIHDQGLEANTALVNAAFNLGKSHQLNLNGKACITEVMEILSTHPGGVSAVPGDDNDIVFQCGTLRTLGDFAITGDDDGRIPKKLRVRVVARDAD